ncbi:MAG: hypothetical protein FJ125_10350, partial [Deltaproteobacteria bacterium]|nr:hypothetical protein [Deltaproteobacteria bacterium]
MSSSTSGCRWLYGVLGLLFVLAGALAPAGLVRAQQLEVGQPQPCEPSTEAWLQQRCGGNAHCRIVEEAIANGLCFLLESRVVADPPAGPTWWLYHDQESVGMTAMAVLALLNHLEGHPWDYAYVQGAIAYLLSKAHADGAIYSEVDHGGARHFVKTYETSLAAVALVAVWVAAREAGDPEPLGGEIERAILSARRYLLDVQNIEAQGRNLDPDDPTSYVEDSPHYGGWGYPSTNRSDLSNTQFAVWALRAIHMTRMNTGPRPHAFRFDSTFPEQRQVALLDWYVQRSQAGPGSGFRYQQGSGVTGMMTAAALWGLWCASAGRD